MLREHMWQQVTLLVYIILTGLTLKYKFSKYLEITYILDILLSN